MATDPVAAFIPRIALFISDSDIRHEMESLLRSQYSSLLVMTEKEKLKEFPVPLIVVVDAVKDVSDIRALHPVDGTRILVIGGENSEEMAAAFEVGADDFITHPFSREEVIEKVGKALAPFESGEEVSKGRGIEESRGNTEG